MPIEVTVGYDGAGTIPALRVKDPIGQYHKLVLQGGKAKFAAEAGTEYKLFWAILGPAGAMYTITLSAPEGSKVEAKENPLKRPLPANEFGYGRMFFSAVAGEAGP